MSLPVTDQGSYSEAEILAALFEDHRHIKFRYQHLNSSGQHVRWLSGVEDGGKISYNYFANTKRTCAFNFWDDEEIRQFNFAQDLFKPWFAILMPDGLYAYIPLGVFLLSSPKVATDKGWRTREVKGYDLSIILMQNKLEARWNAATTDTIESHISWWLKTNRIPYRLVELGGQTWPVARSWDAGTSHLTILYEMLDAAGLAGVYIDANGVAQMDHYQPPDARGIEITYRTDQFSVIQEGGSSEFDLFEVPNKWIMVRSQPDQTVITATVTNDDPLSPTSTVNRGRTLVDFRTDSDAVDQNSLNQQVRRVASEAAQQYEQIEFTTALIPLHGEATTLKIEHDSLDINAMYNEVSWEMTLKAGSTMRHRARRAVRIAGLPVT